MNKKKKIDRIAELFSRFRAEIEILNSLNLYDINIHAENVIIPILNKIYGLNFINANFFEKNTSAIDLIDVENRIVIQVTSTATGEKIKHTIEQYIKSEKYKEFDTLYIYIITAKQNKYSDESFNKIIGDLFSFSSSENILDYSNLIKEVNSWIALPKIQEFLNLLETEFSEEKIEQRKFYVENKDILVSEILHPNILQIFLPNKIYIGKLGIDRNEIISRSWETEWKLKKKCSELSLVKRAMDFLKIPIVNDWFVFENNLISFKPLDDRTEPLNKLLEPGTIESFNVDDFYHNSFKYENAILNLIDRCIQELLFFKDIQWVAKEKFFRFKPPKALGERKITWKNKKTATRTVVKENWNNERNQIINFQQLSFKTQSFRSNEGWYIAITPSWSYTYDGYISHKQESSLITAKKKLETNNAVYQHFMFIAYCFNNKLSEEEEDYSLIKFSNPYNLTLNYKLEYGN